MKVMKWEIEEGRRKRKRIRDGNYIYLMIVGEKIFKGIKIKKIGIIKK